jgi:plastocyanin
MKKLATLLTLLALAALGLAAFGGDDESSDTTAATTTSENTTTAASGGGGAAGGPGGTVSIQANPKGELLYEPTSATVAPGDVTINFDNPSPLEHDVVIEDADGNEFAKNDVIGNESSTSTDAQLEAGQYTYFCSVDGHRDAGMEGTLTVQK